MQTAMNSKFDGERVFFTSDTHFSHTNIIKYCDRPFATIEEMNETIITNWNSVVGPKDIIFHLGDFSFGGTAEWTKILRRLNGRIYLILGNHDLKSMSHEIICCFEQVAMGMCIEVDQQKIYLNHFPFLCFEGESKDVWQLFGHVHTRKSFNSLSTAGQPTGNRDHIAIDPPRLQYLFPTQYDVGVDNNNFTPVSFEQLKCIIQKQISKTKHQAKNNLEI